MQMWLMLLKLFNSGLRGKVATKRCLNFKIRGMIYSASCEEGNGSLVGYFVVVCRHCGFLKPSSLSLSETCFISQADEIISVNGIIRLDVWLFALRCREHAHPPLNEM
ncbi:hypothetical protein P5673_033189 [Acropora cervicornis]|uniref:Secreted protein n=1 Tax=Acropora cervicornis TaxID=6130 RepID=A0AAD9PQL0_ACRCE|nr:hypothetical protein P5673_033189 [Acropora cervicornis]